ncbi:hypothetical protein JKA74_17310 [Marivirga sp. S37H4]|uniref:Outer membrane lipoprotein-sorting protein n=1 Tax=Marivirga aurantiaca TaxID=2802615 RepID=A0A934X1S2_9BACT|nr:hypothetical protein [Marivirga aurantiaca]MBK6266805.1 hypothetical protein [Marivirga aurantiaca]
MYNSVAVEATLRKAEDSRISEIKTNIYISSSGKMVTYYSKPDNIVIINNEKGNVSIYDKNNNTVVQSQNSHYSSKTNQLYYFLNNKKGDLGLSEIGFSIKDVSYEDGLTVTIWTPPMDGMKYFSSVKLVHDNDNPIYMEYLDNNEMVVKKVYFYHYEKFDHFDIPKSITQIDFKSENDSIVSKTQFKNVSFDSSEIVEKLAYKIPNDAKLIK